MLGNEKNNGLASFLIAVIYPIYAILNFAVAIKNFVSRLKSKNMN
jgi:hypothetical protein